MRTWSLKTPSQKVKVVEYKKQIVRLHQFLFNKTHYLIHDADQCYKIIKTTTCKKESARLNFPNSNYDRQHGKNALYISLLMSAFGRKCLNKLFYRETVNRKNTETFAFMKVKIF